MHQMWQKKGKTFFTKSYGAFWPWQKTEKKNVNNKLLELYNVAKINGSFSIRVLILLFLFS